MTDLVKQLRWLGDHASFEPHMHHTAADRIEKLEAALRPFAKWADWHDDAKGTDVERCFSKAQITVGDLRAARKALEGKDD